MKTQVTNTVNNIVTSSVWFLTDVGNVLLKALDGTARSAATAAAGLDMGADLVLAKLPNSKEEATKMWNDVADFFTAEETAEEK